MNEIFDTAPFAYVGENTHYKELTTEEKEELKEMKNRVEKKENPSSEEVQENVVTNMLPQVIPEAEEPNVDDVFADTNTESELLQEALEDEICGGEIYYEKADFIGKIKNIFKKKDIAGVDYGKVEKAAKAYTTLRMAGARLRVAVAQKPEIRDTSKHRDLQRKIISSEKAYRKLKEGLNNDEMKLLNEYINGFEVEFNKTVDKQIADIEDSKKASIKKESAHLEEIITFIESCVNEVDSDEDLFIEETIDDDEEFKRMKKWFKQHPVIEKFLEKYNSDKKRFKEQIRLAKKFIQTKEYDKAKSAIYNLGVEFKKYRDETFSNDTFKKFRQEFYNAPVVNNTYYTSTNVAISGTTQTPEIESSVNIIITIKNAYTKLIARINKLLKKIDKKSTIINESTDDILLENGIDDDMKPILDKLHNKGYKTTSSSSGHNNLVKKGDRNNNGVLDEYLYNDARLVFKGKYNFGKAPQYWYWKKVDNADEVSYLDIEQTKYKTQPGGPSNAFQDWKRKYMKSLENWVDSLPNVSDKKDDVKESVEIKSFEEINNEIDMMYESVLGDLMLEFTDL